MLNIKAYGAEFIGTFALIFIGVGAIAADYTTGDKVGLTGIALAHGLAIAVMVSATAARSGGHLNPAVTLGALAACKIKFIDALGYILFQCIGAICAAALIKKCIPAEALTAINMGTPAPGEGISTQMVLLTEAILTFFLVFVVFGTGIDKNGPKVGGLFIGLAVVMGVLMGGPISGAAMNPARHLGPALLGGGTEHIWYYWVGPVTGGVLAGLVYSGGIAKPEASCCHGSK